MESAVVLNINTKQFDSTGSKSKKTFSGSKAHRIKKRRKEKKRLWKEKNSTNDEQNSGFKEDNDGSENDKNNIETGLGKRKHDNNSQVDGHKSPKKHKVTQNSAVVKAHKKGGVVISSLFRCNPDIPKLASTKVTGQKENVFSSNSFKDLDIHPYMIKTLEEQLHLSQMTSIQKQAIPTILGGSDALVKSQTGSGKTLAFAIPIVQALQSIRPQTDRSTGLHALVVVPTRELAQQCFQVFQKLVKPFIRIVPGCLIGGEKRKAEKASIRKGINILVCTPGRVVDHLQNTASLSLERVQFLVLDEADRLCDLGYEKNIAEIVNALNSRCQRPRQTILLSATLSSGVERLAGITMENPVHVSVSDKDPDPQTQSVEDRAPDTVVEAGAVESFTVPENLKQYFVLTPCKLRLVTLTAFIMWKCQMNSSGSKMVVFMSTQDSVSFHHQLLTEMFSQTAELDTSRHNVTILRLHGDLEQKKRTEVFKTFSEAKHGVLLCTDVAARGLDLAGVHWIVQYSPPSLESDYVHRIGRTARAGTHGQSLLFLMPAEAEYVGVLNKHKISVEEMKMKKILTCLVPVVAELNSELDQEQDNKRSKPRDLLESATYLQLRLESLVQTSPEKLEMARKGYQSFIRAYSSFPKHLKAVFPIRELHLGHVAKTFGLRESPGGIGNRTEKQERKRKGGKHNRPGGKRPRKSFSEFDSGMTGKRKKSLGPRKKKKK